ncbi:MAG: Ig-like domain-containing protein, partial [Clostridia bacterium]
IVSKLDAATTLSIPVSVVIPVKKITATAASPSIHVGETTAITCAYAPEDASLQQATFSSSSEKTAIVDQNGVVTGIARGQTNIIVRSADGAAKASVRITVRQQPTSITLALEKESIPIGKKAAIRATVLPKNADNKKLEWSTSDESIATVDQKGRVTAVAIGEALITATSVEDPAVTASVKVGAVQLAQSISFSSKAYSTIIHQTVQLHVSVAPDTTSNKGVTYHSSHPKIATVDENGLVTGVNGGKATITATTADGSRRRATATVKVIVPVTGVRFTHKDVRVGANEHGTFTATVEPKNATNKNMTWVCSDPNVASVRGTTNRVRISGRRWGRCMVTGTTEDGGFTCSVYADIGSLRKAVVVKSVEVRDGSPYLVLQNLSNMNIVRVFFDITGTDAQLQPVRMSTDGNTLYASYSRGLAPGARTHHGNFDFRHHSNYSGLTHLSVAITGWETDTGFYDRNGVLKYSYTIPEDSRVWENSDTSVGAKHSSLDKSV